MQNESKNNKSKIKDTRTFEFIKVKELDEKTAFKIIELVLNSKLKGMSIMDVLLLLIVFWIIWIILTTLFKMYY